MKALAALVCVAGCGQPAEQRPPSPACEAYATKIGTLMGAGLDEHRLQTVVAGARDACAVGRITADQQACVARATTEDQARVCLGLQTPAAPADEGPRTHVRVVGITGQALATADERAWFEAVQLGVELACNVPVLVPAVQFTATVHYANRRPTAVDLPHAPAHLRDCVTRALSVPAERPASLAAESLELAIQVSN